MSDDTPSLSDLLVGVAGELAAADVGVLADLYGTDDVGIVYGEMVQDPSEIICLTAYTINDTALVNDSIVAVQVRLRALTYLTAADRSAAAFKTLQGLADQTYGGIYLGLMWRQSGAPLGINENRQWEWADTYYARVNWPTTYRTR